MGWTPVLVLMVLDIFFVFVYRKPASKQYEYVFV